MNLRKTATERGSITVEAAVIVPTVILSILAVVYIGMLLYQRAAIQSAAEMSAQAGAAAWLSGVSEIGSGRLEPEDLERIKLYRRLFDSSIGERLASIEVYAEYLSSQNEIITSKHTNIEAVIENYVLFKRLEVTISKCYSIPLGGLLKMFGVSSEITISSKAIASIDEPAEFIRTTDYIIDIGRKIEKNNPGIKDITDKTRNALNTMKSKLNSFLD